MINYKDFDIILIAGASGSGKSTTAQKLVDNDIIDTWVEADDYFMTPNGYQFDRTKLSEAHQACYENFKEMLNKGLRVGVANTFTKQWERQNYLNYAHEHDLLLGYVYCNGNYKNVHGVPHEIVQSMKDRFEPIEYSDKIKTPINNITILVDNY